MSLSSWSAGLGLVNLDSMVSLHTWLLDQLLRIQELRRLKSDVAENAVRMQLKAPKQAIEIWVASEDVLGVAFSGMPCWVDALLLPLSFRFWSVTSTRALVRPSWKASLILFCFDGSASHPWGLFSDTKYSHSESQCVSPHKQGLGSAFCPLNDVVFELDFAENAERVSFSLGLWGALAEGVDKTSRLFHEDWVYLIALVTIDGYMQMMYPWAELPAKSPSLAVTQWPR